MNSFWPSLCGYQTACWHCFMLHVPVPSVPAPVGPQQCRAGLAVRQVPACFSHSGSVGSFSLFISHEKGLNNYTLETFLELRVNSRQAEFYSLLILAELTQLLVSSVEYFTLLPFSLTAAQSKTKQ